MPRDEAEDLRGAIAAYDALSFQLRGELDDLRVLRQRFDKIEAQFRIARVRLTKALEFTEKTSANLTQLLERTYGNAEWFREHIEASSAAEEAETEEDK